MQTTSEIIRSEIENNGFTGETRTWIADLAHRRGVNFEACARYAETYAPFCARDAFMTQEGADSLRDIADEISGEERTLRENGGVPHEAIIRPEQRRR